MTQPDVFLDLTKDREITCQNCGEVIGQVEEGAFRFNPCKNSSFIDIDEAGKDHALITFECSTCECLIQIRT